MLTRIGIPVSAVVLLVYATTSVVLSTQSRTLLSPPAPPPEAPFRAAVAASGLVEPQSEPIAIGAHLPGVVQTVHVRVGDVVERGAPLFSIDARDALAQRSIAQAVVEAAAAAILEAQTTVADMQREYDFFSRAARSAEAASSDELERSRFALQLAQARERTAAARLAQAEAQLGAAETTLERLVVRAPIAGEVLQVNVRPGEFASAGAVATPLMIMGDTSTLHVRVDIDEVDAPRVAEGASGRAMIRGDAARTLALRFVRFEPYVVPKRSLTGLAGERTDTRVLQAIYALDKRDGVIVGQQVDVYLEAGETANGVRR